VLRSANSQKELAVGWGQAVRHVAGRADRPASGSGSLPKPRIDVVAAGIADQDPPRSCCDKTHRLTKPRRLGAPAFVRWLRLLAAK